MLDAELKVELPRFIDSEQTCERGERRSHASAGMIRRDLRVRLRSSDVGRGRFLFVNAQQFREQIRIKFAG